MEKSTEYVFGSFTTQYSAYFSAQAVILLIDQRVFDLHQQAFKPFDKKIIIPSGEANKTQQTVDAIYQQLITLEADRTTILIGIGGGVTTDIVGYVASTYMRGLKFGFVPTTLLAQVDASIGGKNGIDLGVYKNIIGTINQPSYLFLDTFFLSTLPHEEWINGMAEVIKHACIKDLALFEFLEQHSLSDLRQDNTLLSDLIGKNVAIKKAVVEKDPYEKGERKQLNFGHTLGHAIENTYHLYHGQAVAVGMYFAAQLSGRVRGLGTEQIQRIKKLIEQYGLPSHCEYDLEHIFLVLKMDKKRTRNLIHYVLLDDIGCASVHPIPIEELYTIMTQNLS